MALNGMYSVHAITVVATAAITGERFATMLGAVPAAGAGNVGVARHGAAIGEAVAVDINGQVTCTAGAAIAAGALVEVGTTGKAITKASGIAVGRALTAAAADGNKFTLILTPAV
jgi:hypothetical protein